VPRGGDHGLTVSHAVPSQSTVGCGNGGELVQPAGQGDTEQRTPHPRPVDFGMSGREMPQGGAVFGVAEHVLDRCPVPVPVLDLGSRVAGGHVEVGDDERVPVDRVGGG